MRKNAACLLCIACLVLFLASCGDSKPVATQAEQEKADLNSKFLAFASSQNAIADWETALPGGHIWRSFSIEAEHALVRSDGRPVAMRLRLNDIVRRDDRVYLELEDGELYVTLEAPPEVVERILQDRTHPWLAEYAVVATINSVEKPTFETSVNNSSDRQDVLVELTGSTLLHHARGRCLSLQQLK